MIKQKAMFFRALPLCLLLLSLPLAAEEAVAPAAPPAQPSAPPATPPAAFVPALEQPATPPTPPPRAKESSAPALFQRGEGNLEITANEGLEWHETERMYIARGKAKAVRGDVSVEADVLRAYDRKLAGGSSEVWRMEAEGAVHIISKGSHVYGDKATYDIDARHALITGSALRYVTPTDVVTATQSLEFDEVQNMALARGNAQATRDDRTVRADDMKAFFKNNAKGEQVTDRLEAKGKVHIVTVDSVVFCDEVTFYSEENRAILTGNVDITKGPNQIKGDKAEANFKTGVSKILSAGKGRPRVQALIIAAKGGEKKAAPKTAPTKPARKTVAP